MDAGEVTHGNVEVALHRDESQGLWLFGVVVHGEFVPLVSHKLGRIDKHVERGRKREADKQAQGPADEHSQTSQ